MAISVSARRVLGTNWAHAAEYQIKKDHELVTSGIYKYIRNPIYTGLVIAITGAELVAKSYLFIFFALFGFWVAYIQAKREEKILQEHFGKEYSDYMKKSKTLIPFIF
ncbi:isoprenylcysteine carboxylmethyltransferase family protein [Candidatus Gottesmanbacteria bacterium]|nr:isoprenylcysteine carboxylmethyltransferase family protein [Candidatus Gottesmanbacteria bacterium]